VKEYRWYAKYLPLAILSVAVAAALIIRWGGFHQSSATVPAPTNANSEAELLRGAHKRMSANESHSIAMQSPGAVLRHGSDGPVIQRVVANCAKGYVRRGSICEVGAAREMNLSTAASSQQ
jgi:hypothetical protein